MKIFQNLQDRQALENAQEQAFVDQCKEEFVEKSLAASNLRKVQQLTVASYLPNLLSATTAIFFVLYLLSGYKSTVALILGALLLLIVVAVEVGKRLLIGATAHSHFVLSKLPALSIGALILLFAVSMGASYQGGRALVVETASPPPRPHNPQIDSLNALLAAELGTIDRLQKTTWKGKVTSDAVKAINQAKRVQTSLVDRISQLEAADDAAHAEALGKHTSKNLNFGVLLGILAAVADLFLLGMLWTAKRLKFQVAAIHTHQGATRHQAAQSPYASMPPPVLNQVEPQRRGIGFTAHGDNDTDNENRYTKIVNENRITEGNRICEHCGIAYTYKHKKQRFCSEQCRIAAWQERTGKTLSRGGKT